MSDLPVLASTELEPRTAALQSLRTALLQLDNHRVILAGEGDYEALAAGAQDIATLQGDLAAVLKSTRLDIAGIVDKNAGTDKKINRVEVDGVGAVEVKGGWKRTKWESKKLLREVVLAAIATTDERVVTGDGEVLDVAESETIDAIMTALETALPITASLSWRTGEWPKEDKPGKGLKLLGFDDADYCEREDQPRLAIIPKRS